MTFYNTSAVDSVTNLGDYLVQINALSGNTFAFSILALIAAISFISQMTHGERLNRALLTSSFLSAVVTGLFIAAGLVGFNVIFIPLGGIFAGMLLTMLQD